MTRNYLQGSEDDDAEGADYSDLSYYLREKLAPPTLPAASDSMHSTQKAVKMQSLLDSQIKALTKSQRLITFLRMETKDKVPIPKEFRQHTRRVLEIVLTNLKLGGRVQETEVCGGRVVEFSVVEGTGPQRTFPPSASISQHLLSQLPFEKGMLEVKFHFSSLRRSLCLNKLKPIDLIELNSEC